MMGWRKKEEVKETPNEVPKIEAPSPINKEIELIKQKLASLEPRQEVPMQKQEKEITEVVKELPMQPVRKYRNENGQIVNFITIEEALSLIVSS